MTCHAGDPRAVLAEKQDAVDPLGVEVAGEHVGPRTAVGAVEAGEIAAGEIGPPDRHRQLQARQGRDVHMGVDHPRGHACAVPLSRPRTLGEAMFASRTSPRASSRPASSVITTCHSCCVRPRWIGVATAVRRPDLAARRKLVWLATPTTWPRSAEPQRGTDARRRLDQRAVHAAVQDPVWLQQLGRDLTGQHGAVGAKLGEFDAEFFGNPAKLIGQLHVSPRASLSPNGCRRVSRTARPPPCLQVSTIGWRPRRGTRSGPAATGT